MRWKPSGAFTGEIAPPMLIGLCDYVIIGHSERRQFFGETDESVGRKAVAARHGLGRRHPAGDAPRSASHRLRWRNPGRAGIGAGRRGHPPAGGGGPYRPGRKALTLEAESAQGKLAIAYEPVWAIGTGRAATPEIADDVMGGAIRPTVAASLGATPIRPTVAASLGADAAAATPLLYGGSVNPGNAADFAAVPGINGALVGGASLDADAFLSVARAFAASGNAA